MTSNSTRLRVIFFGTRSPFSGALFQALQDGGITVCSLLVHKPLLPWQQDNQPRRATSFSFPHYNQMATSATLASLDISLGLPTTDQVIDLMDEPATNTDRHQPDVPIYEIPSLQSPALVELIRSLQPDAACVACFPKRIPPALLELPTHGFFNVHPSLLPAHRGPAPLFWLFRSGAQATAGGVTIHHMDANFDTGNIAAQASVELPDGISGLEAEQHCVVKGGELLAQVLNDVAAGNLSSHAQPAGGSYQSWPQAHDFRLETSWTIQRAFNFMRGTAEWGFPYSVSVDGESLYLQHAISYSSSQNLSVPVLRPSKFVVQIQFANGVLTAGKA